MKFSFNIVLFDGVCLFCEGWVNYVIDHKNSNHDLYFIPLQLVELGEEMTNRVKDVSGGSDSIFCITNDGDLYVKSNASLRVMSELTGFYGFTAKFLYLLPVSLRDFVYDLIGKRRYLIWGRKDFCVLPLGDRAKYFPKGEEDLPQSAKIICRKYFKFLQTG